MRKSRDRGGSSSTSIPDSNEMVLYKRLGQHLIFLLEVRIVNHCVLVVLVVRCNTMSFLPGLYLYSLYRVYAILYA